MESRGGAVLHRAVVGVAVAAGRPRGPWWVEGGDGGEGGPLAEVFESGGTSEEKRTVMGKTSSPGFTLRDNLRPFQELIQTHPPNNQFLQPRAWHLPPLPVRPQRLLLLCGKHLNRLPRQSHLSHPPHRQR